MINFRNSEKLKEQTEKLRKKLNKLTSERDRLGSLVELTIDKELDRLIPEEDRINIIASYTDEMWREHIGNLNANTYFTITGQTEQQFIERITSDSSIITGFSIKAEKCNDPGNWSSLSDDEKKKEIALYVLSRTIEIKEAKKPASISQEDWDSFPADKKKYEYYKSLPLERRQEYIFRGLTFDDIKTRLSADPKLFFSSLTTDDKLYLLAQYSVNETEKSGSRQKSEAEIAQAQKDEDDGIPQLQTEQQEFIVAVKEAKEAAKMLIEQLEVQKEGKIEERKQKETLKASKETRKAQIEAMINSIKSKLMQYAPKSKAKGKLALETEKTNLEQELSGINDEISNLDTEISAFSTQITAIEQQIIESKDQIKNLSDYLSKAEKMEIKPSKIHQTESQTLPPAAGNTFPTVSNSQLSQKTKSSNMLWNMVRGNDSADFRNWLNQTDYKTMIDQAYQLRGPFKKRALHRFYDIAEQELLAIDNEKAKKMKNKDGNPCSGLSDLLEKWTGVKLDELKHIDKLDEGKLAEISRRIDGYEGRTEAEKQEIDIISDYLKIAILRRQSMQFRGIWEFFNRDKAQRTNMLSRTLSKLASSQSARKNAIVDRFNAFRKSLHLNPVDKSKIIDTTPVPDRNGRSEHEL